MKRIINIRGMMCDHCVNSVTQAVKKLDGVNSVEVSLSNKNAIVDFDEKIVSLREVENAIKKAGYEVLSKRDSTGVTFLIEGMMCEHCVRRVTKAIEDVDGVKSVKVDLEKAEALVNFENGKEDDEKIFQAVANSGYIASRKENRIAVSPEFQGVSDADEIKKKEKNAAIKTKLKKEKYDIIGMSCAACQQAVTRAVSKIDGVKEVNVNLLSNSMTCEYDQAKVDSAQIMTAVDGAGYQANLKNKTVEPGNISHLTSDRKYPSEKFRLIFSIPILLVLMYIGMGNMIGLPQPSFLMGTDNALTYAFTQFLLTLPIFYVNRKFFASGFKTLFKGSPNMDSLVAIGSSAALIYGVASIYAIGVGLGENNYALVQKYVSNLYFETGAMILTLVTLGKYLEARSKRKTNSTITKLMNMTPKTAKVIRDKKEIEISVDDIAIGDIVSLYPGEYVPVDGIVVEGESSLDESAITGESIPVDKKVGDSLVSASINKHGFIRYRATKVGKDTTIAKIIELIENANSSKAPIARLADKVAGVFVPIVISLALITGIAWIVAGYSLEFALNNAIGVLVISCPCALGLATPVAITVSTGKAASKGILMKSAEAIEELKKIDTVVLDKTGTITEGKPSVQNIIVIGDIVKEQLLAIASSLEAKSEHPLASAIVEANESKKFYPVDNYLTLPGFGVKGNVDGKMYYVGKIQLMKQNNIDTSLLEKQVEKYLKLGQTPIYVSNKHSLLGIILVSDTIKSDSKKAIEQMRASNLEVIMLTGDNELTAHAIADEMNIDRYISNVMPSQKEEIIRKLQKQGKKVAMVGDGINDSPALTRADVGIAIGSGTDIAIESADVVLIKSKLSSVLTAINISKNTVINIKENLFWALFYNVISIPIAAGLLYPALGFGLSPMIGAAAMSVSSIFVSLNALRLKYKKIN